MTTLLHFLSDQIISSETFTLRAVLQSVAQADWIHVSTREMLWFDSKTKKDGVMNTLILYVEKINVTSKSR